MMTEEWIIWGLIGLCLYSAAYLIVSCGSTIIWKIWATHKVGIFWEYGATKGMEMYYPNAWYFIRRYHVVYSVLYAGIWPIAVPIQLVMMTKALNKMAG